MKNYTSNFTKLALALTLVLSVGTTFALENTTDAVSETIQNTAVESIINETKTVEENIKTEADVLENINSVLDSAINPQNKDENELKENKTQKIKPAVKKEAKGFKPLKRSKEFKETQSINQKVNPNTNPKESLKIIPKEKTEMKPLLKPVSETIMPTQPLEQIKTRELGKLQIEQVEEIEIKFNPEEIESPKKAKEADLKTETINTTVQDEASKTITEEENKTVENDVVEQKTTDETVINEKTVEQKANDEKTVVEKKEEIK